MELKRHRRKTEINIVPLIDVLIVLVFFFLMTMQFRDMEVLNITPPKFESAGSAPPGAHIVVSIKKDGALFIDADAVTRRQMINRFEEIAEEEDPPDVLIQADEDAALKHVTTVMDEAQKAGVPEVRLLTR